MKLQVEKRVPPRSLIILRTVNSKFLPWTNFSSDFAINISKIMYCDIHLIHFGSDLAR